MLGDCTLCSVLGEFTRATKAHPEYRRLCDRHHEAVLESERTGQPIRGMTVMGQPLDPFDPWYGDAPKH